MTLATARPDGRPNRLHDRLRYQHTDAGAWRLERLAP
jgi:pyridoxine/pyridoxamine 5'-phosphate oxidase